MKTKIEIEQSIIKITSTIREEYPELSKFIAEMPVNNSESVEITLKSLEDYYNSLENLLDKYAKTHRETEAKENTKTPNEKKETWNEKNFNNDMSGADL